jgi:hypothetical protein
VVGLPVEMLREELATWGKPRLSRKSAVYSAGR